ncbi:MAG TPA: alkaline phosphatase family protein [Acidimicrobiales bacterium]|nr:alkaline phosphatase family protein [Acidimicrobiales bacterium]
MKATEPDPKRSGPVPGPGRLSRRALLGGAAVGATGAVLAACGGSSTSGTTTTSTTRPAGRVGVAPNPKAPVGSDQLPQFDHIVVVMMENHSFDNILGTLGRGDGLKLGPGGAPQATNPDGHGHLVRSFHMPNVCQLKSMPAQSWNATQAQYANGTNQGFVTSASGPVAMGYWTAADMPFTNSLARTFPLADRYFSSVMAQTYPNRRYLMAGTSLGQIRNTFPNPLPPNGTIFDQLNTHDISWKNYYTNLPTLGIFLSLLANPAMSSNLAPIKSFYSDCAAGSLPSFCIVDPDFVVQSEENPQDIQYGDAFLAQVVNAVMSGPKWSKTLLVWNYDEHGGYYDHVVPPAAVAPDDVPPTLEAGDTPGQFNRLGFRVPAGLVSPYAKQDYVSHTVFDHTSVLKLVETKWNLPAMTRRDAAANDLLDMVDFNASPGFLRPPKLAAAPDPAVQAGCLTTGPGFIPPPSALIPVKT